MPTWYLIKRLFIDSATLDNCLWRGIGYVPRSKKSSRATVSFFVDTSTFANKPAHKSH